MKQIIVATKITIALFILTGVVYPVLVWGLAKVIFPRQSEGSLLSSNGKVIGSALIGQKFTRPEYFHGRPSAAGNDGYDALSSSGSNYGPTNQKLIDRVRDDVKKFRAENPTFTGPVPADMITASASGLDPDISPEAAYAQAPRIAAARQMSVESVRALIAAHIQNRQWGFLGEPRVNVLELNLALNVNSSK